MLNAILKRPKDTHARNFETVSNSQHTGTAKVPRISPFELARRSKVINCSEIQLYLV